MNITLVLSLEEAVQLDAILMEVKKSHLPLMYSDPERRAGETIDSVSKKIRKATSGS